MAITSTTTNNLALGTSSLVITSGSTIENIVYTNSSNSFLFASQSSFSLSPADYISFCSILDVFNTNIQFNFKIPNVVVPFSINSVSEQNDGVNSLTYSFYKSVHPMYNISGTYPGGNLSFGNRTQTTTLTFDEWLYYHESSKHFESQVIAFYKVS